MKQFIHLKQQPLTVIFFCLYLFPPIDIFGQNLRTAQADETIGATDEVELKDYAFDSNNSQSFPFDVSFYLTHTPRNETYRVALIYGLSSTFSEGKRHNSMLKDMPALASDLHNMPMVFENLKFDGCDIKVKYYDLPDPVAGETQRDILRMLISPLKPNKTYNFYLLEFNKKDYTTVDNSIKANLSHILYQQIWLQMMDSLRVNEKKADKVIVKSKLDGFADSLFAIHNNKQRTFDSLDYKYIRNKYPFMLYSSTNYNSLTKERFIKSYADNITSIALNGIKQYNYLDTLKENKNRELVEKIMVIDNQNNWFWKYASQIPKYELREVPSLEALYQMFNKKDTAFSKAILSGFVKANRQGTLPIEYETSFSYFKEYSKDSLKIYIDNIKYNKSLINELINKLESDIYNKKLSASDPVFSAFINYYCPTLQEGYISAVDTTFFIQLKLVYPAKWEKLGQVKDIKSGTYSQITDAATEKKIMEKFRSKSVTKTCQSTTEQLSTLNGTIKQIDDSIWLVRQTSSAILNQLFELNKIEMNNTLQRDKLENRIAELKRVIVTLEQELSKAQENPVFYKELSEEIHKKHVQISIYESKKDSLEDNKNSQISLLKNKILGTIASSKLSTRLRADLLRFDLKSTSPIIEEFGKEELRLKNEREKTAQQIDMIHKTLGDHDEFVKNYKDSLESFLKPFKGILELYDDMYEEMDKAYKHQYGNEIMVDIAESIYEEYTLNMTFLEVTKSSVNEFTTRANYSILPDFGMAFTNSSLGNMITPFYGVNFNFRPVNKQAHYSIFKKERWGYNFLANSSIIIGLSPIGVNYANRSGAISFLSTKKFDNSLLVGYGIRCSDFVRFSVGTNFYQLKTSTVLKDSDVLVNRFYFGLSLDWDVRKTLRSLKLDDGIL